MAALEKAYWEDSQNWIVLAYDGVLHTWQRKKGRTSIASSAPNFLKYFGSSDE